MLSAYSSVALNLFVVFCNCGYIFEQRGFFFEDNVIFDLPTTQNLIEKPAIASKSLHF